MKKKQPFNFRLFLATRRFLAMSIAFGGIATIFLLFLAYPRVGSILQLRKKIDTESAKLAKYQAKARELEQLTKLEEFKKTEVVDQVLPSHKPLLELIANLNQVAKDNKISIEEFSISPGKIASQGAQMAEEKKVANKKGYEIMDVAFKANGKLENLETFLQKIEQLSPITSIGSMSLQRKEQDVEGELLISASADLVLGIHYYNQSVQTTIEASLPKIGKDELSVFETIVGFGGTEIEKQTIIKDGGNEDLFGIDNLEELQKELGNQKETKDEGLGGLLQET